MGYSLHGPSPAYRGKYKGCVGGGCREQGRQLAMRNLHTHSLPLRNPHTHSLWPTEASHTELLHKLLSKTQHVTTQRPAGAPRKVLSGVV
jgi:hypothetical protein